MYTTKQAADELGIDVATLKYYLKEEVLPAPGTLLNPRMRVFTAEDIEVNRGYLEQHPAKKGPDLQPDSPHSTVKRLRLSEYPDQQRVADQMNNLVRHRPPAERRRALDAIVNFERAGWYPTVFEEVLPGFITMDGAGITYDRQGNTERTSIAQIVETLITDYLTAVAEGGGTVIRE